MLFGIVQTYWFCLKSRPTILDLISDRVMGESSTFSMTFQIWCTFTSPTKKGWRINSLSSTQHFTLGIIFNPVSWAILPFCNWIIVSLNFLDLRYLLLLQTWLLSRHLVNSCSSWNLFLGLWPKKVTFSNLSAHFVAVFLLKRFSQKVFTIFERLGFLGWHW